MMDEHAAWMRQALAEAEKAAAIGDVPIGAVAVWEGIAIGRGHNRKEYDHDPIGHAEIMALREAARTLGTWRLSDVTLYCTLEPCAMCAGAMIHARLERLVWATGDPKAGACGSVIDLLGQDWPNHHVEVVSGVLAEEAQAQIRAFFGSLRAQGKRGRRKRTE